MISRRHWMICDDTKSPCMFDEEAALKRGDPPRCIRHGALLFSERRYDGLSREQARKLLDRELGRGE